MAGRPAAVDASPVMVYQPRSIEDEDGRMANTPQAKKRVRQLERRTKVNHARLSRIRTFVRRVEEAIAGGDRDTALEALRAAQPEIMRGASKGVLHSNTAGRKVSRLSRRIGAMPA